MLDVAAYLRSSVRLLSVAALLSGAADTQQAYAANELANPQRLVMQHPQLEPLSFRPTLPDNLAAPELASVRQALEDWAAQNTAMLQQARLLSQWTAADPMLTEQARYLVIVWQRNAAAAKQHATPRVARYAAWADLDADGFITPVDLTLLRLVESRERFGDYWRQLRLDPGALTTSVVPFANILPALRTQYEALSATSPLPASVGLLRAARENQLLQQLLPLWHSSMQIYRSLARGALANGLGLPPLNYSEQTANDSRPTLALLKVLKQLTDLQPGSWLDEFVRNGRHSPASLCAEIGCITELRQLKIQAEELDRLWLDMGGVSDSPASWNILPLRHAPGGIDANRLDAAKRHGVVAALKRAVEQLTWMRRANDLVFNPTGLRQSQIDDQGAPQNDHLDGIANAQVIRAIHYVTDNLRRQPDLAQLQGVDYLLFWLMEQEDYRLGQDSAELSPGFDIPKTHDDTASVAWRTLQNAAVGNWADEYTNTYFKTYMGILDDLAQRKSGMTFAEMQNELAARQKLAEGAQNALEGATQANFDNMVLEYERLEESAASLGDQLNEVMDDPVLQDFNLHRAHDYFRLRTGHGTVIPQRLRAIELYFGLDANYRWLHQLLPGLNDLPRLLRYDVTLDGKIDAADAQAVETLYSTVITY